MRMSDLITKEIIKMLNESEENTAEIQRNEFAGLIGCAPSQINYVLSSRFTPEPGINLLFLILILLLIKNCKFCVF